MARIINGRLANGSLASIVIEGATIEAVLPQPTGMIHDQAARSLEDAGDFSDPSLVYDAEGELTLPGLVDIHVHSRDPGLTAKETWETLARGAYKGGVVAVCDMPNTKPPTMTRESVLEKAAIAARSGLDFKLFLGVGASNINEIGALLADETLPLAGLKIYYGQSTGELMYSDLEKLAASLPRIAGRPLVFHSEDQCAIDANASRLGNPCCDSFAGFKVHSEIRSSAAAHASTRTILEWARAYGRAVHIAHLSTPAEVELVLEARRQGVSVTTEVAPHHLLFSTADYERLGPWIKMNPPVRSPEEVARLVQYFGEGLIDVFATDHAPHTKEEKLATDYARCPSGVPAVEYFLPLLLKAGAQSGLGWERAVAAGSVVPARLFGFTRLGSLGPGMDANLVWFKVGERRIDGKEVLSKCGWTPYDGLDVPGEVRATWHRGRRVYDRAAR